jgi:large subunit ribosomal protein L41e
MPPSGQVSRKENNMKRSSRAWKKRGNQRWKWRKKKMRRRKRAAKMRKQ